MTTIDSATSAVVGAVTAIPAALGAVWGFRRGIKRISKSALRIAVAYGAGGLAVSLAFRRGWFEPWGLLTPGIIGTLTAIAAWIAIRWIITDQPTDGASQRLSGRCVGSAVGGALGTALAAAAWTVLFLVQGLMSPPPKARPSHREPHAPTMSTPESESFRTWSRALIRTANRGFVRHLPFVGEYGDEIEGLIVVLNAERWAHEQVAREYGWEDVAALPSYQAVIQDPEIHGALRDIAAGDVTAIYTLQRNPRLLRFMKEKRVRELIATVRPSKLAREIEAAEAARVKPR